MHAPVDESTAVSGRHRPGARRSPVLLLSVATAVGVWLGVSAPEVSPVTPPGPAAQAAPGTADGVAPGPVAP